MKALPRVNWIGGTVLTLCLVLWQPLEALGWRAGYLPGSALVLALAGGGLAVPADLELTTVNPAHLLGSQGQSFEYGYLRMFGGLGGHTLRWQGQPYGKPTQLGLRSLSEDRLELRGDIPTAEPLAYFGAHLVTVTLRRGYRLGSTSLGLGLTGAYQRIFHYSARGLWLTAGWRGSFSPALSWGLAAHNLGYGQALNAEAEATGARLGAGLAYQAAFMASTIGVDLWYDGRYGAWPVLSWQAGGQILRLYAGLRWIPGAVLVSAGFRLTHHRWSLTYAVGFQEAALGLPQMLTVGRIL